MLLLCSPRLLLGADAVACRRAADEIITRWYSMLVAANEDGLATLLSDEAVIKLAGRRHHAEQDPVPRHARASGASRSPAAASGTRSRRPRATSPTVLACYDFAENDILMRETFKIDGRPDRREHAEPQIAERLQRLLSGLTASLLRHAAPSMAALRGHLSFPALRRTGWQSSRRLRRARARPTSRSSLPIIRNQPR